MGQPHRSLILHETSYSYALSALRAISGNETNGKRRRDQDR